MPALSLQYRSLTISSSFASLYHILVPEETRHQGFETGDPGGRTCAAQTSGGHCGSNGHTQTHPGLGENSSRRVGGGCCKSPLFQTPPPPLLGLSRPCTGQLVAWNVHGAPPWHWTQGKKIQEVVDPSQFWKGNQPFLFSFCNLPPMSFPPKGRRPPPTPRNRTTTVHAPCMAQKLRQKTKSQSIRNVGDL